ncbi:MAG: hypothetical protein ACHP84_06005 [Caulobacterales bacterium]
MVSVAPVLELVGDFAAFLEGAEDDAAVMAIRRSRSTGRPVDYGITVTLYETLALAVFDLARCEDQPLG